MTQTIRRVHDYLSTYCWHENHGDCRLECKTCARPCRCECHAPRQGLETPPERQPVGQPAASNDPRPVAFVVVREEHGVMTDAVIFDSLTAANTAEGIASGYAEPGEKHTVYALTDITEENPNA